MSKNCRVCKIKSTDLSSIFTEEDKNNLLNLRVKIQWCYGIEIDEDGLSSMICNKCSDNNNSFDLLLNNNLKFLEATNEDADKNKSNEDQEFPLKKVQSVELKEDDKMIAIELEEKTIEKIGDKNDDNKENIEEIGDKNNDKKENIEEINNKYDDGQKNIDSKQTESNGINEDLKNSKPSRSQRVYDLEAESIDGEIPLASRLRTRTTVKHKKSNSDDESDPEWVVKKKIKQVFQCKDCSKNYSNQCSLIDHAKKKHNMYMPFTFGPKSYSAMVYKSVNNTKTGNEAKASTSGNKPVVKPVEQVIVRNWKCDLCDFAGYKSVELVEHKKTHNVPMQCPTCGVTCKNLRYYVTYHKKTHEPPKCYFCFRSFENKQALNAHMDVHVTRYKYVNLKKYKIVPIKKSKKNRD